MKSLQSAGADRDVLCQAPLGAYLKIGLLVLICLPALAGCSSHPASSSGGSSSVSADGAHKHDPQEDDPRLKKTFQEAERKVERELVRTPRTVGFIHIYWSTKKRILKKDYGIDWKTPEELNPHISYHH